MNAGIQAVAVSVSREATENALLDALENVLQRDGLRNLSVNAVVAAAGVGKPLLYRYFGDLAGLVRAWSQRRGFWAGLADETAREDDAAGGDREFRARISDELVAVAEHLRANPVNLEFLAEELTAKSDVSEAFGEARDRHRRPFMAAMLGDARYRRRDHRRVIVVMYAALVYLAMRSRRAPHFMGLRLDTNEGWQDALDMVRELAQLMPEDPESGRARPARRTRIRTRTGNARPRR